jgi:hypothetical protein
MLFETRSNGSCLSSVRNTELHPRQFKDIHYFHTVLSTLPPHFCLKDGRAPGMVGHMVASTPFWGCNQLWYFILTVLVECRRYRVVCFRDRLVGELHKLMPLSDGALVMADLHSPRLFAADKPLGRLYGQNRQPQHLSLLPRIHNAFWPCNRVDTRHEHSQPSQTTLAASRPALIGGRPSWTRSQGPSGPGPKRFVTVTQLSGTLDPHIQVSCKKAVLRRCTSEWRPKVGEAIAAEVTL